MKCNDINRHIDDYLDRQLSEHQHWAFVRHIEGCHQCALRVGEAITLHETLKQIPVQAPADDFEHRVFAEVRRQHAEKREQRQRFHFASGFATAAVASLAIWFVSSVFVNDVIVQQPQLQQPQVISFAMHETQTVRLLFDAPRDIQQVSLSIDLPGNMALEGYPGRRALSWHTSLHAGQNVLALPILAIQPGQGELLAQLSYGDTVKTFSVVLKATVNGVQSYRLNEVKQIS